MKYILINSIEVFFILFIIPITLLFGNFFEIISPVGDLANYHCYAEGFWHGNTENLKNPFKFKYCQKSLSYFPAKPFHVIPKEYPILSLIPFSLPLLIPFGSYQLIFSYFMLFVIIGFYFYLSTHVSRKSGMFFIVLMIIGALSTAVSRFDLLPAITTFFCVVAAEKKKFFLAYMLLAVAIFLKLYPAVLFFPLLLSEQQSLPQTTPFFKRIMNMLFFSLICLIFISFSFVINSKQGLIVFDSYAHRPFEFESLSANSLELLSMFKTTSFCLYYSYGSINAYETSGKEKVCRSAVNNQKGITHVLQVVFPLILAFGILWVIKLQREKKFTLSQSFIALILLLLVTGKILSPQFLIWLIPLIVFVRGYNKIWLGLWISISLLTMLLYPHLINLYVIDLLSPAHNAFWDYAYLSILTLRNGLLIVLTVYHIFFLRNYPRKSFTFR